MNNAGMSGPVLAVEKKERLVSLDVFRGITILFMIIVNNPGNPRAVYPALEHASWHGLTPTDLVFPSFLFISGVSITFALAGSKRKEITDGYDPRLFLRILKRGLLLILIGIAIHSLPSRRELHTFSVQDFFAYMRYPGVLQRIGLVYMAAASLFLVLSRNQIAWLAGTLLALYYFLMHWVPVPGVAPANFDPALNFEAYLDRAVLGTQHLYRSTLFWDPEGVLSTLPSISTGLLGILAGYKLKSQAAPKAKVNWLVTSGTLYLVVGIIWAFFFPLNKNLWSSSFVLVTAGIASLLLALCYFLVDLRGMKSWTKPFLFFGMNSILAYACAETLETLLGYIYLPGAGGRTVGLFTYLYQHIFQPMPIPLEASSALWSLCYALLFLPLLAFFYRRKIFLKV